MTPNDREAFLASLRGLHTLQEQKHYLEQHQSDLDDALAEAIKAEAETHIRADARLARRYAHLLYHFATLTNNLHHRGLGLFAEANACSFGGMGEYQRAIDLCDEAARLYRELGQPIVEADAQITKIYALTMLGQMSQALQIGGQAASILETNQAWARLIPLTINLALVHGRMGRDAESLRLLEQAEELCARVTEQKADFLAGIEMNRAVVLRNLGRFNESIHANQNACEMLERLGQRAEVGHAQQVLAYTNYMLGRYNEALQILLQAKTLFEELDRRPELLETELYTCECYLQLRRFGFVVETAERVAKEAKTLGLAHEISTARSIEAAAYVGSGQFEKALTLLLEREKSFDSGKPSMEQATTQLQIAQVLFASAQWQESLVRAQAANQLFTQMEREVESAYALLSMGEAAARLQQIEEATAYTHRALATGQKNELAPLIYRSHHLLGTLAEMQQDLPNALDYYSRAADELEKLSSQTMLEYRSEFMTDKSVIYEDMVRLYLATEQPALALGTVERAKSRALITLLAHRVNLSLESRDDADQPLIDELTALQAERDRLVNRLENETGFSQQLNSHLSAGPSAIVPELRTLEEQMTERWHRLLIRNADYATQASLWQVKTEPIQPLLDDDTLLLEYFIVRDKLLLFAVTKESVEAMELPCQLGRIQRVAETLHLNLRMAPQSDSAQLEGLVQSVQKILEALHQFLVEPASTQLESKKRLIIVPHDLLHYLPFHAFYSKTDGYLLDQFEISYLPASSILPTVQIDAELDHAVADERHIPAKETMPAKELGAPQLKSASFGHSYQAMLPYAVEEAQAVASITGGIAYVDDAANRENFRAAAIDAPILHLATHGHFRADDPLYSGLALADGWQTTFDTFNLKTKASLVTLSACQTGRSVIGGGDELLGLTRAFLAAGARSLLLSQWTVEDKSTALMMNQFYVHLMAGQSKVAALRAAQQLLREDERYNHPYFWAAFSLLGDGGPL